MDIREFFRYMPVRTRQRHRTCLLTEYKCKYCSKEFSRSDALASHIQKKRPCHPSHPNYVSTTHCEYCNRVAFEGKSKQQITKHRTYCKKFHDGTTYAERQKHELAKYEANELKRIKKELQDMDQLKEELKRTKERLRILSVENQGLRNQVSILDKIQYPTTTIIANIEIDELFV